MARPADRRLADAGEVVALSGSQALLLDDPSWAYYVVEGQVEIFTVTRAGRAAARRAQHFLTVADGQAFFGMATGPTATPASWPRATPARGAPPDSRRADRGRRRRARPARRGSSVDGSLPGLHGAPDSRRHPGPDLRARAVDRRGAAGSLPRAAGDMRRQGPPGSTLEPVACSTRHVSRCDGAAGAAVPAGARRRGSSPAAETGGADRRCEWPRLAPARRSAALAGARRLPRRALCECEFINKRLALVDEFDRLEKQGPPLRGGPRGRRSTPSVRCWPAGPRRSRWRPSGRRSPLLEACRLVAVARPCASRRRPRARSSGPSTSRCWPSRRPRGSARGSVALRGDWWRRDQGPLLAVAARDEQPRGAAAGRTAALRVLQNPRPATAARSRRRWRRQLPPLGLLVLPTAARRHADGARACSQFGVRGLAPDFRLAVC